MRNLKKILALVLALVMSFSLMATANAFKDDEQVSDAYAESVAVLAGMKVFEGYEDGSFQPTKTITREEVAAIIYRIVTTDVTNSQKDLYIEGAKFDDVASTRWSAGYIGYCANGGLVTGYGDGKFGPADQVTGYQVLAMILRAVGYDKNGEFTGAAWQKNVATYAQQLGILDNVSSSTKLSDPATRELVAELLFQTIYRVKQVEYTPAFGYQPITFSSKGTQTIGQENFGLTNGVSFDSYYRPYNVWYNNVTGATYYKCMYDVLAEYTTAVNKCDLAEDLGLRAASTYMVAKDGNLSPENALPVNGTGVYQPVLGTNTGVLTQVFVNPNYAPNTNSNDPLKDGRYIVVEINTYLAKVTNVVEARYDYNSHVIVPASMTLEVYVSGNTKDAAKITTTVDGNDFAKGEYVLVQGVAKYGEIALRSVDTAADAMSEIKVLDIEKADSITGVQNRYWSDNSRTVEGTKYASDVNFYLDETHSANGAYDFSGAYTWFFDHYNNLIGAVEIDTVYSYGIITNIQWQNPSMSYGYAQASLMDVYTNESSDTVYAVDGTALSYNDTGEAGSTSNWAVSTNVLLNDGLVGEALYKMVDTAYGKVMTATASKNSPMVTNNRPAVTTADGALVADSTTVYLVQYDTGLGAKYVTYTGYANVPSLTGAEIYYVMDNGFIDICYITDAQNTATNGQGLVYVSTTSHSYDNNTRIYTFYDVYVNGEKTELYVSGDAAGDCAGILASGGKTFFAVNYTNGVVVSGAAVSAYPTTVGSSLLKKPAVSAVDTEKMVIKTNVAANSIDCASATIYEVSKTGVVSAGSLAMAMEKGATVYVEFNAAAPYTATVVWIIFD